MDSAKYMSFGATADKVSLSSEEIGAGAMN